MKEGWLKIAKTSDFENYDFSGKKSEFWVEDHLNCQNNKL